jgi:hypothetical protein
MRATVRSCSRPFAQTGRFAALPNNRANGSEPERTPNLAILATESAKERDEQRTEMVPESLEALASRPRWQPTPRWHRSSRGSRTCASRRCRLGERSYLPYDDLLNAHRAAVRDLLEILVVSGGHSVTWDALDETSAAIAASLS